MGVNLTADSRISRIKRDLQRKGAKPPSRQGGENFLQEAADGSGVGATPQRGRAAAKKFGQEFSCTSFSTMDENPLWHLIADSLIGCGFSPQSAFSREQAIGFTMAVIFFGPLQHVSL
jgi:hypothetical protein